MPGDPPFLDENLNPQVPLHFHTTACSPITNNSSSTVFKLQNPFRHRVGVQPCIPNLDGEYEPNAEVAKPSSSTPVTAAAGRNRDLRLSKSSPCLAHQIRRMTSALSPTNAPTVVRRPGHASRPVILTGDNAQDSYTPSPPFGPFENKSNSPITSFFRSSVPTSPLNHLSTAPTSFFSSRDSQVNGTSMRPAASSSANAGKCNLLLAMA
jgi:hypothetical protein